MTPRSKHVLIIILFVIALMAGLLFAQRVGGRHVVKYPEAEMAALLVESEPVATRVEKSTVHTDSTIRSDIIEKLK